MGAQVPICEVAPVSVAPRRPGATCVHAVAQATRVPYGELIGPSRKGPIVKARQIAFWLLKHRVGKSYPQAGRLLGRRRHTAALHGARCVDIALAALPVELPSDLTEAARALWRAPWPKNRSAIGRRSRGVCS